MLSSCKHQSNTSSPTYASQKSSEDDVQSFISSSSHGNATEPSVVHCLNALDPIDFIYAGISTLARLGQLQNVLSFNEVKPPLNVAEVSIVQFQNPFSKTSQNFWSRFSTATSCQNGVSLLIPRADIELGSRIQNMPVFLYQYSIVCPGLQVLIGIA